MEILELKKKRRIRRKYAVRNKVSGTCEVPRLTVYKSIIHIYAQIIDDVKGQTLVSASTIDKEIKGLLKPEMTKTQESDLVGEVLAKRALEKNITNIAFDRNGHLYHGRVKALADGCRRAGLKF